MTMSFRINKPILKLLITGFGSIFVFVSCDELESVNPADLSYTLKAPTLVSVQAVSDVQMSITWHNNEEHSKEFVISRKSGSGSYSAIGTVLKDLLAFTDTACVLGTEYSYVVQSKVSSNYSVNSNTLKKASTFSAPSNLTVIPISDESVRLTWTDNTVYETGFTIERDGGSGFTEIGRVLADVIEFTDTGLTFDQSYDYRVAAITANNTSGYSNTVSQATEFPAPSELTASSVSESEIQLTWTDNTGYETDFKIERDDDGSGFVQIGTVLADVIEFTDSGLTFGQSYAYRVAAYTSVNTSSWVTITAATGFPAPSDLSATGLSDSEIQLTWTDNTGYETGFKIERDGGSGFLEIGMVSANVTEYTDVGLSSGESYGYRVAAITANNTSDYSSTATATATTPLVDWDGNTYGTVEIGNQVWMAENLKVTHYRDGTPITPVTDHGEWTALTTEAYCFYNNNASNGLDTYGALYNWYAVNGDTDGDGVKDKEIAPEGWHVPTDAEWTTLTDHLGGASVAGGKLKETGINHWNSPNAGATNESGFTALPGGSRYYTSGYYYLMGYDGYFWSATENDSSTAWYRTLRYNYSDVYQLNNNKRNGFSVRCVRD